MHRNIIFTAFVVCSFALAACSGSSGGGSGSTDKSSEKDSKDNSNDKSGDEKSGDTSGGKKSSSDPAQPAPKKKKIGAQCEKSADCEDDFCVFLSGGGSLGMCTKTCDGDIDCPGLDYKCAALADAPQKVCVPK